jgi:hypothetical protein
MPRGAQGNQGFRATRWPTFKFFTAEPASATTPIASCPSTLGNEINASRGLSKFASRKICLVSLPQIPQSDVRTTVQSSPSKTGCGISASRVGPRALVHRLGEIFRVICANASLGSLYSKVIAFIASPSCKNFAQNITMSGKTRSRLERRLLAALRLPYRRSRRAAAALWVVLVLGSIGNTSSSIGWRRRGRVKKK